MPAPSASLLVRPLMKLSLQKLRIDRRSDAPAGRGEDPVSDRGQSGHARFSAPARRSTTLILILGT
jgi:hypothetical protein